MSNLKNIARFVRTTWLPAALLIKLAQGFGIDLHAFGGDEDARTISDLMEAFSDPAFDTYRLASTDVRDLAINHPQVARAVLEALA